MPRSGIQAVLMIFAAVAAICDLTQDRVDEAEANDRTVNRELSTTSPSRFRSAGFKHSSACVSAESPLLRVDLNTAPVHELALLPSIGPVLARRIHGDRKSRGPYADPQDLRRVHGIGTKIIEVSGEYCVTGKTERLPALGGSVGTP